MYFRAKVPSKFLSKLIFFFLERKTRTEAQKRSLYELLKNLVHDYPTAKIVGHRELPCVTKACLCFDASKEYADLQPK